MNPMRCLFYYLSMMTVSVLPSHSMDMPQPNAPIVEEKKYSDEEKVVLANKLLNKVEELYALHGQEYGNKSSMRPMLITNAMPRFILGKIKLSANITPAATKKLVDEIFEIVGGMGWLRMVSITTNIGLDSIPVALEKLKELKTLVIQNNDLKTVAAETIRSLESLDTLNLSNNPLVAKSGDVQEWGVEELNLNGFFPSGNPLGFKSARNDLSNTSDINEYAQYFFSDVPGAEVQRESIRLPVTIKDVASTVVVNEEGVNKKTPSMEFEALISSDSTFYKRGEPLSIPANTYVIPSHTDQEDDTSLTLGEDIPIGYQVYLPKDIHKIKAMYVNVYGGGQRNKLEQMDDHRTRFLLKHGIAVIVLNLLDLYELDGIQQSEMPLELHQKLHLSIDYFFKILKSHPEMIGINPDTIRGKRIILEGASYGGRTAVRHAELYPYTFDGYISHDGALNYNEVANFEAAVGRRKFEISEWIVPFPQKRIEKIADPILLLQNYDDNNVGMQTSTSWYEKARQAGKQVQLFITPKGNPIPKGAGENVHKGHFVPTDHEVFHRYMNTVLSFILNGSSNLDVMSDWHNDKYKVYSDINFNQNYETLSLEKKFMTWAYRLYTARHAQEYPQKVRRYYENQRAIPDEIRNHLGPHVHPSWKAFDDQSINYETIYDALAYVEGNKDLDLSSKNLTDHVIANMLTFHIPLLIEYLLELPSKVKHPNYKAFLSHFLLREKNLLCNKYRELISGKKLTPLAMQYLYRILLITNPQLLEGFRKEKSQDKAYLLAKEKALRAFDDFIQHRMQKYPRKVFQSAVKEITRENQVRREAAEAVMKEYQRQKQP